MAPALGFLVLSFLLVLPEVQTGGLVGARDAEAIVGRPASPTSVGGVRRRTRRRTTRRWAVGSRTATLPGGCARRGDLYHCDGTYFRPYYQGTSVTYVVVNP
jgi:hypothetical protein